MMSYVMTITQAHIIIDKIVQEQKYYTQLNIKYVENFKPELMFSKNLEYIYDIDTQGKQINQINVVTREI